MLLLEPEGARHPATARIYFNDIEVRPLKSRNGRAGAHQRLLMTVAVKQRLPRSCLEVQGETIGFLLQKKLFKQEARLGHLSGVIATKQFHRFIAQREQARGFEPDDCDSAFDPGFKLRHVPCRVLFRLRQHSFRDEGAAAALLIYQLDAVAGGFQKLDGGATDLRRVVSDKGVVEENHRPARRLGYLQPGVEPISEGLARECW